MHGKNKIRKQVHNANLLQVNSVFYTIQGEGPFSGRPAVFIRLTGCNLRCWFCDTQWDDNHDPYVQPQDIIEAALTEYEASTAPELAVITGGEPCRQDLSLLIKLLKRAKFEVQVETAGTIWQDCLVDTHIVVSPKTPKVAQGFMQYTNNTSWKYVVNAGALLDVDGLPVHSHQERGKGGAVARPPSALGKEHVYLQPCDEYDELANTRNLELVRTLTLVHGYRASVQLHKILEID